MQPFRGAARGLVVEVDDETIYSKVKDDLVRYASVLVGPDRAPDVVSTVMVRVLARRTLTSLEEPRAYLFRSVLNECRGLQRKPPPAHQPAARSASIIEPDWAVVEAVAELPTQQRAAVYVRYWEDLQLDEIGAVMGVRPGTVKRYLHLARRRLKGVLS